MFKNLENMSPHAVRGPFPSLDFRGVRVKLSLVIQLFFWLFLATSVQAATFDVNNAGDLPLGASSPCDGVGTCTLRAAVQAANAASNTADSQGVVQPDIINIPAGTYTLTITNTGGVNEDLAATGDLDITESVTLTGAGSGTTLIDGNNIDRVFHIIQSGSNTVAVNLSDVTVENGYLSGGIGSGIYNNGGTVTITNATISNNMAKNTGVATSGATGGGIYNNGTLSLNTVTVSGNTVDLNSINGGGGGGGGGIYNTGSLRVENSTITNNQVINDSNDNNGGGGIENVGTTGVGSNTVKTVIIRSIISDNTAPLGGGVRNLFGRVDVDLAQVENNAAELSGGGIQNYDGGMSIQRSVIRNNTAKQTGAGVDNLAALDILQSSIYGNQATGITTGGVITAGGGGGGIFNGANGALNLANTTINDNQALAGGGIYNHKDLTATNSTIFDNKANNGTEVFACGSGSSEDPNSCNTSIKDASDNILIHTNFVNTIVGNSTTTDNCSGDPAELITSQGHNIETANTCGFSESGDTADAAPSSFFTADYTGGPKYNGGDVAALQTYEILSGGLANDTGDFASCPVIDERGFERNDVKDGKCDIGAYEISTINTSYAVLDLALGISYKIAAPQNGTVQTTVTFTVYNKGPIQAKDVVLTVKVPALSWIKITSLDPKCALTSTGFTCTEATIEPYASSDFFLAVLATSAGAFTLDGVVESDGKDNYHPDNLKSATINIPTVAGSNLSGNNFAGSGGGGSVDWLWLALLAVPAVRRLPRR